MPATNSHSVTSTVGITELRQKFGHYVARVKKGETLIITKRGREIARFEPTPAREHGIEVLPPS